MHTLISKHLDRRYEEKQQDLNQNLQQQSIGVQLGTDGWKRKHVNEGQKLLNFIANYLDGGTAFLAFADTEGAVMDHLDFLRIMKEQISSLSERLGSVEKMLGCGNQVWQQSHGDVLDSAEALQRAVNDSSFQITAADAQEIRQHKTDFSFVESLQRAVRLLEPILALLQGLEQDKPLLSQCLPAWYSVYQHVQSQAQENLHFFYSMRPVLHKRLVDRSCKGSLRKDLEGLVTIQLTMLQVNGLGDVQVGAELTKKRALPDTIGRHTF
ncbi:TPA: hypothetical protein ACH3X1_014457 [Trebouxia sp. C0004]